MNTDQFYAQAIANEYTPKDTSKVVALKKLDWAAKRTACLFGYSFGIGMTLVLGLGMCLSMQVIGSGRRSADRRRDPARDFGAGRGGAQLPHLQETAAGRQGEVCL